MDSNNTNFKKLALTGWRQFEDVDIDIHPRLTIITGANGAGKSSIIRIFSRHFGFDRPYLSTPIINKDGGFSYFSGIFSNFTKAFRFFNKSNENNIGKLIYNNAIEANLNIPAGVQQQYHLEVGSQQAVAGIHIDSHQTVSNYQVVSQIPSSMTTPQIAYNNYYSEVANRYHGNSSGNSPLFRMKESLIGMAVFGEGNSRHSGNPALLAALNGFIDVLKKILPPSLGFVDLIIRSPEVILKTSSGEFLIDSASGGVSALIDISWRIYMYSLDKQSFVVTIDEPENHLHPSMQRTLMSRLLSAFPQAQFIVATHSPFIVTSVKDSYVYVLRYNFSASRSIEGFVPETTKYRIISEKLDAVNKSSSANEILREVLGVEATIPEWAAEEVKAITKKYETLQVTAELLTALRKDLLDIGFGDHYPFALADLVKGK